MGINIDTRFNTSKRQKQKFLTVMSFLTHIIKWNQVLHEIHLVIALSSVNYIFIVFIVKTIYLFKYCYFLLSLLFFK